MILPYSALFSLEMFLNYPLVQAELVSSVLLSCLLRVLLGFARVLPLATVTTVDDISCIQQHMAYYSSQIIQLSSLGYDYYYYFISLSQGSSYSLPSFFFSTVASIPLLVSSKTAATHHFIQQTVWLLFISLLCYYCFTQLVTF